MPQQSDPWVEAAKNYKASPGDQSAPTTAPSGSEDWKIWQQNDDATAPSGNGFQQRIDNAINTPTQGPQWLDKFGRGAAQAMLTPIAHPIQSAKGFAQAAQPDPGAAGLAEGIIGGPAGPMLAHTLKGVYDDYKQNGLSHALGNVAGGVMAGEATGGAFRGAGGLAKATGAGIDNFVLGTGAGDVEHGANPGAAIARNRIWGSNPKTLLNGLNEVIPDLNNAHNADIARFTRPGSVINSQQLVSDPFSQAVNEATDPVTGAAMPTQIAKTLRTQRALTHALDPNTGQITPSMRQPTMSPLQANKLKSNIYGMTDYDNPSRAAIANNALKKSAHNLKSAIETAVPEAKESGQQLHDAMAARDILTPQAKGTKLYPPNKAGMVDRVATAGATGGAAALDAAGSGLANTGDLARYTAAPILLPHASFSSDDAKKRR